MRRLEVMIEDEVDEALERVAVSEKTSKEALVRKYVRERVALQATSESDPLMEMAGVDDFEPANIDEVVYR